MRLSNIAGEIAKEFEFSTFSKSPSVSYLKNGNHRDVVTNLDLRLHSILEKFCLEQFPKTTFLSEENTKSMEIWRIITESPSIMVVDPLDGSNNLVNGLRDYGCMVSLLEYGKFVESLILIPNDNQIITWSIDNKTSFSKRLTRLSTEYSTSYLAYSPRLSQYGIRARSSIIDLMDRNTAGVFRYGTACVGLYRTILGVHSTFVGLEMRPWDVISYFPILKSLGAFVAYSASDEDVSVIASFNSDIFRKCKENLSIEIKNMIDFEHDVNLRVTRC